MVFKLSRLTSDENDLIKDAILSHQGELILTHYLAGRCTSAGCFGSTYEYSHEIQVGTIAGNPEEHKVEDSDARGLYFNNYGANIAVPVISCMEWKHENSVTDIPCPFFPLEKFKIKPEETMTLWVCGEPNEIDEEEEGYVMVGKYVNIYVGDDNIKKEFPFVERELFTDTHRVIELLKNPKRLEQLVTLERDKISRRHISTPRIESAGLTST